MTVEGGAGRAESARGTVARSDFGKVGDRLYCIVQFGRKKVVQVVFDSATRLMAGKLGVRMLEDRIECPAGWGGT